MIIAPNKLTQENINQAFFEQLIQDGIEEDVHLDYKREIDNNSGEIAKDLSAFANSDGGYIVYGIEEEMQKPKNIIPIIGIGIKERLDQIAQSGIDPALNTRIIAIDVNVNGISGQIFLVYIPKKYPILHFAKKKKRFYYRSNFISIPMERYQIEQAYNKRLTIDNSLKEKLGKIEKDINQYAKGYNLHFRFNIYPIHTTGNLFEIGEDMNKFLTTAVPKTPIYDSEIFKPNFKNGGLHFRQKDYFFNWEVNVNPTTCLIRKEGIIIYGIYFRYYNRENEKDIKQQYDILNDPLECIRRGVIFGKKIFNMEIIIDFTLGFLNFLYKFYTKLNYFGDINIILRIKGGLQNWIEPISGNNFRQNNVEPIELMINTELIQVNKLSIVKDIFKSIFNGFGLMENDLNQFYTDLQLKLKGYK